MAKQCKGTTLKGACCKRAPQDNSDYCYQHNPKQEENKIREFVVAHREGILAFLAGAASDPIVGDIYDLVKEQLGLDHLVPPVRSKPPEYDPKLFGRWLLQETEVAGKEYRESKNAESLFRTFSRLWFGTTKTEVLSLLGPPDSETKTMHYRLNSDNIDVERLYYLTTSSDFLMLGDWGPIMRLDFTWNRLIDIEFSALPP